MQRRQWAKQGFPILQLDRNATISGKKKVSAQMEGQHDLVQHGGNGLVANSLAYYRCMTTTYILYRCHDGHSGVDG